MIESNGQPRRLLVTGGAGFIGSTFVHRRLAATRDHITVVDKLTYAGNPANLAGLADDPATRDRYRFVQADIADEPLMRELAAECDAIVNFAAESHVDRSILEPAAFLHTGVMGVYSLLEAARAEHERRSAGRGAAAGTPGGAGRRRHRHCRRAVGRLPLPAGLDRRGLRPGPRRPQRRGRPDAPDQPLQRRQGGRRAPRGRLPRDARPGHRHHARRQHLRPQPVPREAHPALHHQRARRRAAADVRRRHAAARLALRGRPRRRHRRRPGPRRQRRRLQHPRRRRGAAQSRGHRGHPGGARQALVARPPRARPAGPRSALRARRVAPAGTRLAAARHASRRASPSPSPGTPSIATGGSPSRAASGPTTTAPSTPGAWSGRSRPDASRGWSAGLPRAPSRDGRRCSHTGSRDGRRRRARLRRRALATVQPLVAPQGRAPARR